MLKTTTKYNNNILLALQILSLQWKTCYRKWFTEKFEFIFFIFVDEDGEMIMIFYEIRKMIVD